MGYFPLLILLVDDGRELVVHSPSEIPNGTTFTVLETNYLNPIIVNT